MALKAVSMNEITWEDTGLWKKFSLLQYFRGRLCRKKKNIKIMPETCRENKYNKMDYTLSLTS